MEMPCGASIRKEITLRKRAFKGSLFSLATASRYYMQLSYGCPQSSHLELGTDRYLGRQGRTIFYSKLYL
jgi:hypothetical protein